MPRKRLGEVWDPDLTSQATRWVQAQQLIDAQHDTALAQRRSQSAV